MKQGASDLTLY